MLLSTPYLGVAASKPDKISTSIGLGTHNYSGQIDRILNRYSANKKWGRLVTHVDLVGLYWIQNNSHILLGANLAADIDMLSVEHADFYFLNFHTTFSGLYFVNNNHKALFFRGDIGFLRRMIAGDPHFEPEYTWGFSSMLAVGYAIPIFKNKTTHLQLQFMPTLIKNKLETHLGTSIGFMF